LDLSSIQLQNKDATCIAKALLQGVLHHLEELILSSGPQSGYLTAIGLAAVIRALSGGACPNLKRLVLSCKIGVAGAGAGEGLAALLAAGYGRRLQELDISRTFLGPRSFTAISQALDKGSCPNLRRLLLTGCHLVVADGQALSLALRNGACPQLEVLELANNPNLQEGIIPVMEALAGGACPRLQRVDLHGTHMMATAGMVFARGYYREDAVTSDS